jgi:hypothetical protein
MSDMMEGCVAPRPKPRKNAIPASNGTVETRGKSE